MAYPVCVIFYADPKNPTASHGISIGGNHEGVILNPGRKNAELHAINLGEVASRTHFTGEPAPEDAMPHQVVGWAKDVRMAIEESARELDKLRQKAYAGQLKSFEDAWEDPDLCRLGIAMARARDRAQRLAAVGQRAGVNVHFLQVLANMPIRIIDRAHSSAALLSADEVASKC